MEELKEFTIVKEELQKLQYAIITTNKGVMRLRLFIDSAPQTITNFANLANNGFYDNLKFHRVIENFMAQGGCPIGNGTGGPGYRIKCELKNNPNKHERGTISMAHAGRDTGGSQFFICFSPQPHLNGEHTTFGKIIDEESLATLDSIKQGDIIQNIKVVDKI